MSHANTACLLRGHAVFARTRHASQHIEDAPRPLGGAQDDAENIFVPPEETPLNAATSRQTFSGVKNVRPNTALGEQA